MEVWQIPLRSVAKASGCYLERRIGGFRKRCLEERSLKSKQFTIFTMMLGPRTLSDGSWTQAIDVSGSLEILLVKLRNDGHDWASPHFRCLE